MSLRSDDNFRSLVGQCLAGDQSAMLQLVERFWGQVYGLCYRMLSQRQDAEDAAQETFVRVLKNLHRWDCEREFSPWLLAIAGNRCRTALAARRRRPVADSAVELIADDAPDQRPADQLAEEVQLALAELRPEYRQAFVLFHEHELSYAEIAESMEVPLGTIKTWVHRARRELIGHLSRRGVVPHEQHSLAANNMNCYDFETRLNLVLDHRGNPAADLQLADHAAQCPDCQRLLSGQALVLASIGRVPHSSLGRAHTLQIVELARPAVLAPLAPAPASRRLWLGMGVGLAAAAALLLVVTLGWVAQQRDRSQAAGESPAPFWARRGDRRGNLAIFQPGTRRSLPARVSHSDFTTADLLIAAPRLPAHLDRCRDALDQFAIALPQAAQRLEEMEQLSPGLRPLRASLALIWDTLFGAIPHGGSTDTPAEKQRTTRQSLELLRVA